MYNVYYTPLYIEIRQVKIKTIWYSWFYGLTTLELGLTNGISYVLTEGFRYALTKEVNRYVLELGSGNGGLTSAAGL